MRAAFGGLVPAWGVQREAYVPTKEAQSAAHARLPAEDADARGPEDSEGQAGAGPGAHLLLGRGARPFFAAAGRTPMAMWERLHGGREFRAVFEEGASFANALAALYVVRSRREGARVGVAAGKRLGGAVVRNRHRRRWREILRRRVAPPRVGVDMVLVSRARAKAATMEQLEGALRDLLARAGLESTQ